MRKVLLVKRDRYKDDKQGDKQYDNLLLFLEELKKRVHIARKPRNADGVFVLGGDGTMLRAIRKYREYGLPFYGFNFGTEGFLLNDPTTVILEEILIGNITPVKVRLLGAKLYGYTGNYICEERAFNDFYFERVGEQSAKFRVTVDGKVRFDPIDGDGIIVATTAGSTGYTASARGSIIPIESDGMVLTGICPNRRFHWLSMVLPQDARVILEAVEIKKRPVRFLVDGVTIKKVVRVEIRYSDEFVEIDFAASQPFREKVYAMQLGDQNRGRKIL